MSGIYKALKNVRRRSVETILETVGASERTVDEEFETLAAKFDVMMGDMNECTAALHKTLVTQKAMFGECKDFATIFARIYQTNKDDQEWPPSARKIEYFNQAAELKRVWDFIQDVIRSSTTMVCAEESIAPMKQTMSEIGPSIENEKKDRETMLKDYDSYRRRLKALEAKRDAAESNGKGGSEKAAEILAEISKFENKVTNSEANYVAQNSKTKAQILAAKELHDEMMDNLLITALVTQAETFGKAAQEIEGLLAKLPQAKVSKTRAKVAEYLKSGGVQLDVKDLSALQKGIAIATGKALPSDFAKAPAAEVPVATPVSTSSSSNPFADAPSPTKASSTSVPPPPPTAPPPPPPPAAAAVAAPKKHLVIGLYDHEPDAEDELAFSAGDVIEVLDSSDEGWWKGRFNGKEGLFPTNYVQEKM